MSGVVEKVKAKVEQVLHKDKSHGSDPTGPHDSHAANKADPRVDSDHIGTHGNTGAANTTHGTTHGTTGSGLTGTHGTTGSGLTGTHGTTGSGLTGTSHGTDPTGPHDSHLANKADPRVDSDRYGASGNTGAATHGTGAGLTGGNYGSDPTGPHDSHLVNKADPRVDSDRYGAAGNTTGAYNPAHSGGLTGTGHSSGLTGSTGHSSGLTGNTYGSDPTGPHDSHLANKADPRVDASTAGGYGNTQSTGGYGNTGPALGGLSSGPGPADNTAGPHKSDLLNKADPRVDSNLDGSKTFGGNKTSGY